MKKHKKVIVVGSFIDESHQIWAPDACIFESVEEAMEYIDENENCCYNLARELNVETRDLEEKLENINHDVAMNALIRVLQMDSSIAIREFRTYREAENFLNLIEQIAEKKEKEKQRQKERLIL